MHLRQEMRAIDRDQPSQATSGLIPSFLCGHAFSAVLLGAALALALIGAGCDSSGVGNEDEEDDGGEETVVPAVPSGLEGSSGDSEVTLSWDAADDAETYNVYRDTTSGVDADGDPLASSIEETSYTDSTAENGRTYYYVVTSVNASQEESPPSEEIEKTPFSEPPSRPSARPSWKP